MEKWQIGFLTIVVMLTGAIVVTMLQGDVRVKVQHDKSIFYVYESGSWVVSGTEYLSVWNGSRKLRFNSSKSEISLLRLSDNRTEISRLSRTNSKPAIMDVYSFDGSNTDKTLFPVQHSVQVINASGMIFQYEVKNLDYSGPSISGVKSPQNFGKMKVEWQSGNYYSRVFNTGKLVVRYRIGSDDSTYLVRLFDPPQTVNITYPPNATISGSNDGNESISLNFTVGNYTGIGACTYLILNSSGGIEKANFTIPSCLNTTFNVSHFGTFTLKLYVNDTAGTMNESTKVFKVDVASLNLTFGPNIRKFTWIGCGQNISNLSAQPANQTSALGIDYVCNNGTASGNVEVKLNLTAASGWQIFASNSSLGFNFTNLTNATNYRVIYKDLANGSCKYIWYNASCNNVTTGPQTYEIYRLRRD